MKAFADMGPAGNRIKRAFDLMEIAERVIETKGAPRDVFKHLCPSAEMLEIHSDVYESHVQEICWRSTQNQSLTPATNAEVLCALLSLSLKAPLKSVAGQAAERLFANVFGRARTKQLFGAAYQEERDSASVDAFIEDARRDIRTGR